MTLLQLPDRVPYHFEKVFVLMINMAKDFLRFKQLFYTTFKVYNIIRLSSRISLFLCFLQVVKSRSNQSEVFLGKGVLKIYSKFTGKTHIEVQSNFIDITLRHGCSPVNLLHIFRTPFYKNTSGWVLLDA